MDRPDQLHFTQSEEANRLLATDGLAVLIGMLLDQQFPMERAFYGPPAQRLVRIRRGWIAGSGRASMFGAAGDISTGRRHGLAVVIAEQYDGS
jgi:hypothetical protein